MAKVRAAEAVARAAALAQRDRAAGPREGHSKPNDERQQWSARRKEAIRLRQIGTDPWRAGEFFHSQCKVLRDVRLWHTHAPADKVWEAVVHKCRCEERRAQARVTALAQGGQLQPVYVCAVIDLYSCREAPTASSYEIM